ncbi:hypothetical protein LTR37_003447 [Vermiconidia calcicola]|uniref:Uncharacterized protein n=1 Tax=Vermiconidia calcicola TaxID=1690605 RepID=A0ACC3NR66_9PEZI|nr:hypothetical protein LTR37_003447 [Vermiconidia calcicola]
MAETEEEDDYLSMTFGDASVTQSETSLQRTARLKKEAAERGRVPSKAELAERQKAAREAALATQIDSSNKGAKMMAKMGFKGGALGRADDARTNPIDLQMKDDRGGIGMDGEKKRKVREAAEAADVGEKRQKVGLDEFRERSRAEGEEKRAEGLMWGAMKVLEGLEADEQKFDDAAQAEKDGADHEANGVRSESAAEKRANRLRDVNVLHRPLLKQRQKKERELKMRYDLNNSLSTRNDAADSDEDHEASFDRRTEDLDDEDSELADFEALSPAERLEKIVMELREKYHYCFWCKHRYPDAEMGGCPGLTEDEHG